MASGRNRRKLLRYDRVEVRTVEAGFLGSWHPAQVIHSGDFSRLVQYDHILNDEGSAQLIETVIASPAIEGRCDDNAEIPYTYRGTLRPSPPICELDSRSLRYGQCIDFLHKDSWWEGVIFDKKDGNQQRRIFFPDMGDELNGHVNKMRLTQDWDEVSEEWKQRGNWLLLDLIEEFQKVKPLPVSVMQIWYDVRSKSDFETKLREWTTSRWDIWRDLVNQVLIDNFNILCKHFLTEMNSSLSKEGMGHISLPSSEAGFDSAFKNQRISEIMPSCSQIQEQCDQGTFSMPDTNEKALVALRNQDEDPKAAVCNAIVTSAAGAKLHCSHGRGSKTKIKWLPYESASILESPTFSEAIHECKEFLKIGKKIPNDLMCTVRNHLFHVGWKVEFTKENGIQRFRYFSPDGQVFYSLCQICRLPNLVSPVLELSQQRPLRSSNGSMGSKYKTIAIEPEYCPEAVRYWYHHFDSGGYKSMKQHALKATKHLSALGWSFKSILRTNMRRDMTYISPGGLSFSSLRQACRIIMSADDLTSSNELIKDVSDCMSQSASDSRSFSSEEDKSSDVSTPKRVIIEDGMYRKRSRRSSKTDDDDEVYYPIRVLTSSKRRRIPRLSMEVKKDLSSDLPSTVASFPRMAPRSISSLLINKNVISAGTRVIYRDKNNVTLKEGLIYREGIKCSCCGEIYTLSKFEEHSGSSFHRPSANIFLEDGRSIADCQMQIGNKFSSHKRSKPATHEANEGLKNEDNDCICSICHFGGELLLCDQCPSSFHTHCLGLKDVPVGNWYCPPCCCRICSRNTLDKTNRKNIDPSVLICSQCEQRYHADCILQRGKTDLYRNPDGEWLCQDSCQQIYSGLMKILGKPISLGGIQSLRWTLLKHKKSDSSSDDPETCSKLNKSLSVMHECFKPVKELRTGRDLVEDVIFNRSAKLHRLNFQGFYTVLLENNDDLISVATVRIYGKRVAEVPLVATRFRFRRLGMCRILIDELEKQLMELGIERLVLPAVPSVLDTWTGSFGFSVMNQTERLRFIDHTFLDFQGTVFCHKMLIRNDSTTPLTRESLARNRDAETAEGISPQESTSNAVRDNDFRQSIPDDKRTDFRFHDEKNIKYEVAKCYKRRRISAF